MNRITKILIIIVFLMSLFVGIVYIGFEITGKVVSEDNYHYTYTKAICKGIECADFLVSCEGNKATRVKQISDVKIVYLDRELEELC